MIFLIIIFVLITLGIKAVNNSQKTEISSLEREISELKKVRDDRALLQAEIYRLRKENLSLMKRF